jgi:hypothetical protein
MNHVKNKNESGGFICDNLQRKSARGEYVCDTHGIPVVQNSFPNLNANANLVILILWIFRICNLPHSRVRLLPWPA